MKDGDTMDEGERRVSEEKSRKGRKAREGRRESVREEGQNKTQRERDPYVHVPPITKLEGKEGQRISRQMVVYT